MEQKRKIAISACLLGENCKYNGGNNRNEAVLEFLKDKEIIAVCPEVAGGLPTPRIPAELVNGAAVNREGKSVDTEFRRGVELTLEKLADEEVELVILQPRSPSCGVKQIYDGSFTGTLINGQGMLAGALMEKGYKVLDADDITNL